MEQITRRDDGYYYGERRCATANDAYGLFRADYHKGLGRVSYRRLDRAGRRVERIHGFGFVFGERLGPGKWTSVRYRILGLVGVHYCRIVGCWEYLSVGDDEFDDWFDRVFERGNGLLRLVGKKDKSGRTAKRRRR